MIVDFSPLEDQVHVTGEHGLSQAGANVLIDLGNGDTLILQNVSLASLPAGWILG